MKFRFASLLFLLSSAAFINSPASSMQGDDFYDDIVGSGLPDRLDDSEEDFLDGTGVGVVEQDPQAELEEFLNRQNYPRIFRSIKESGNTASDKEIVRFLLKNNGYEGWSTLSPIERAHVVGRIAYEADRDELEEFLSKQNYPLVFRSIKESGNTASNEEIVRYLLEQNGYKRWPFLSSDKRDWIVDRITTEEEVEHVREFLRGQNFPQIFRSLKESGNKASNEEIAEHLITINGYKRWETLKKNIRNMTFRHIIEGEDIRELQELLRAHDFSSAFHREKELRRKASDEEIVGYLLTSNGYTKWEKISEELRDAVIHSITGQDPVKPLSLFDDRVDFWKAYHLRKGSKDFPLSEEVVKSILEQKGFKFWDRLLPDLRLRLDSYLMRGHVLPFPEADIDFILAEERAAVARKVEKLTEGMSPDQLGHIVDVAFRIDEEDIEPRVAAIVAHLPRLFTPGMTEDDKAFIIKEALKISSEEIGARMEALIAHQGNLIPPEADDYDRAEYIVKFLYKTVEQILDIANHVDTVFSHSKGIKQELLAIENFRDLTTHHISRMADVVLKDEMDSGVDVSPHIDAVAENISKVFTNFMNEPDRNAIIVAALRIKARRDIGPRMDAISRNAGPLFKGIKSHSQIADLTVALLGRSTSDINAIAEQAATLYVHLSSAEQVNAIETFEPTSVQILPIPTVIEVLPGRAVESYSPYLLSTDDHALIADLADEAYIEAITRSIHKVFTSGMKKVAKRTIIQAALCVNADDIGPRLDAISRNAQQLFRGISDGNHIANLAAALLGRSAEDIENIASSADALYLTLKDKREQFERIKVVRFFNGIPVFLSDED